jgi:hypothetical protein
MRYDCPATAAEIGGVRSPMVRKESFTAFSRTDRTVPDYGIFCRTSGRTLTCGYGFQRSHRTQSIDLRITRPEDAWLKGPSALRFRRSHP